MNDLLLWNFFDFALAIKTSDSTSTFDILDAQFDSRENLTATTVNTIS